jgi:hypothetical protein
MNVSIRAIIENADDGQGWNATIHLPLYPIFTAGPPMDRKEVLSLVQRTVRGFFTACAKAGLDDGTPIGAVISVDVEYKKS